MSERANPAALLEVEDLKVQFKLKRENFLSAQPVLHAVDGVSFVIERGKTLGLVGESGCGKSTSGLALLGLVNPSHGKLLFDGVDLTSLNAEQMFPIRKRMQIIFQDPYGSLNPRMTCGDIVGEPLKVHKLTSNKGEYRDRVSELLLTCGLNPYMADRYPHEFSGGQRQRIGIARALAVNPSFIVCDEPVSALDVSIQAQIVNLLEDLQDQLGLTYLFIAHDLSVVKHISDRIAVMYLGHIVEVADRNELYENPIHPYTKALLSAIPIPDPLLEADRERIILRGGVPSPMSPPSACSYDPLCPTPDPACDANDLVMKEVSPGHSVAYCEHCVDEYGCHWFPREG